MVKSDVLQSMGSQQVVHNWAGEQQQHIRLRQFPSIFLYIPSSFPTLPPCGEARSLEIERRYRMPSMGLAESKRFPYVSVSKHPAPSSLPFFGGRWGILAGGC